MEERSTTPNETYEYLILGGGPAGLQMAYFLARAGRRYLILEAGDGPGSFFRQFPRHRTLISINKVHTGFSDPEVNLRFDWNSLLCDDPELLFRNYSEEYFPPADQLLGYLEDFRRKNHLALEPRARAVRISRPGPFRVETADGRSFLGDRLLVATGVSQPYVPAIPGIELAERYFDADLTPASFADQRVLVVGKGNSGFETAEALIPHAAMIHVASPHSLQMAWKTHFVGHLRAVNNNFLDTYQLKSQNAVLDAEITGIERGADGRLRVSLHYSHAEGESEVLVYDRVVLCTGFRFDASPFTPECEPELTIDNRFPRQSSAWESTNVPDLYFLGTLSQARDFKKTTSGFIHGFRYNVRALSRILAERYHQESWPETRLDPGAEALTAAVLQRVNRTSALWQQFGFLADAFVVDPDGGPVRHYEELPVVYLQESALGQSGNYFQLTLEFGKVTGDPFSIQRCPDPAQADRSVFLHPVIRHFVAGEQVSEHHVLEHLLGEWWDDALHRAPLHEYLARELPRVTVAGR